MLIENVTIENFRGIPHAELKLKKGINLVIGDNGVGKTSILEAMVVALGACFINISEATSASISRDDILQEMKIIDNSPFRIYRAPVRVSCIADLNGEKYSWVRIRQDEGANTKTTTEWLTPDRKVSDYFRDRSNDINTILPVIGYHGISRVLQRKRSDFALTSKKLDDRRCGYTGCLDKALDDKFIRKWCFSMEKKVTLSHRYVLFKQVVTRLMKELSDLETEPAIYYSEEFEDFVYSESDVVLPISCLSAGYQSMLWLVMDIAFRILQLNPFIENMNQATGVILIDEIDMHLHPKWQWRILDVLHDSFPEVQYIITTHAPIVISSCKHTNILRIDNEHHVTYPSSAYAYPIDDIVELIQGSSGIPYELKLLRNEFDRAFFAGSENEAQTISEKMAVMYGDDNAEVMETRALLSM